MIVKRGVGGALLCGGSLLAVWTMMLALAGWYPTQADYRTLSPAAIDSAINLFRVRCYVAIVVSGGTTLVGAGLCFGLRRLPIAAGVLIPLIAALLFAFGRVIIGDR